MVVVKAKILVCKDRKSACEGHKRASVVHKRGLVQAVKICRGPDSAFRVKAFFLKTIKVLVLPTCPRMSRLVSDIPAMIYLLQVAGGSSGSFQKSIISL
jgi:hypothetical protein